MKERSVCIWPPLRAKYLPSSTWELYQKQRLSAQLPSSWSSAFLPRTPDWQNSSVVDRPRTWKSGGWELAWYCLGRLMLRQSKCFASAFWPSHASPSESRALSWEAFSWKKFSSFCFVKKIILDGPRLSNRFFFLRYEEATFLSNVPSFQTDFTTAGGQSINDPFLSKSPKIRWATGQFSKQ